MDTIANQNIANLTQRRDTSRSNQVIQRSLRRRRRRASQNSNFEQAYRPWVATLQVYCAMAKLWLLLLCYGVAILRLNKTIDQYQTNFNQNEDYSCPSNRTAPLCCQDANKCQNLYDRSILASSNDQTSSSSTTKLSNELSFTCGYDADMSFYVLNIDYSLKNIKNNNISFQSCCRTSYLPPYQDDEYGLASGSKGGAPGGVIKGQALGINRCCLKGETPTIDVNGIYEPCEISQRCTVARKAGGCCLHASSLNATGWTPLTASLRWRPVIIYGANSLGSLVILVRGIVSYCRECLGWPVLTPQDLWRGRGPDNRRRLESEASCWSTLHASALASICVVIIWAAFIPFWWEIDVNYYSQCHPDVLGLWTLELLSVSDYWRFVVQLDCALTAAHVLTDLSITKACTSR